MITWIIVASIIVLLVAFLLVRKKRAKRRETFRGGQKHPNGYIKYHQKTKIQVYKALEEEKSPEALAVFRFKGDIKASAKTALSHCIDEIILNKKSLSECVIVVESPGGSVTDYGYAFSEIRRLREEKIKLTVCIDTVAASGGYLMSLPAQQIIAAPFAMVGSIGVVSFVPNIRKLLEKNDITPRTFTAGQKKRTITLTDEAAPEDVKHYEEQLALIHTQFKSVLKEYRPQVDVEKVATGEAWLAQSSQELDMKLVDQIQSSSSYLLEKNRQQTLVEFSEDTKNPAWKKFMRAGFSALMAKT